MYADDGPYESATSLGSIELQLGAADFPLDVQADMLGYDYYGGMLSRTSTAVPPYIAVGGRALKSNGKYRYFWLVKGKMQESEQAHATKKDTIEWQTPTMTGAFVKRDCDNIWQVQYDEDAVGADPTLIAGWFLNVIGPKDLPMVFTSNPKDGAVDVAKDVQILLKFNKDLTGDQISNTNITITEKAGSTVTAEVKLMADKKSVTIAPSTSLTAATEYTVTVKKAVGVADDTSFSFTTIA